MEKSKTKLFKAFLKEKTIEITISTGSMLPLIKLGEKVIVKQPGKLMEGDIVCVVKRRKIVVHRIIKHLKSGKFLIKGDFNFWADEMITKKEIIGQVVETRLGRINTFSWHVINRIIALFSYIESIAYTNYKYLAKWLGK